MLFLYTLLTANLFFSLLNSFFLFSLTKIAVDVIDVLAEERPGRGVAAVEEPGLIDIDTSRMNYSGMPTRID